MTAFIRYELMSFIRSLKFIPPAVLYLAWIFILYAYKNVPVLSSYGVSSICLYLTMTWIAMVMFSLEVESEKHILFTHLRSKERFLCGKWLTCLIVMVPIMLFAIFFPIITGSFNEGMKGDYYALAFFSHIVFAILGILVGSLFSATFLATRKYAWLSAVFFLVCSLASKALIETLEILKWIVWIFPPVFKIIDHMSNDFIGNMSFWFDNIFVFIYIIFSTFILIYLFLKKEK
ncbi:hypothetical protein J2Z40_003390 [Cytobacillus eiseniae]|uniref:ABC transporter permease n=1 Tax=Cytobacillus eiseniae TaxID=762947 RepID=A0ABS4RJA6_9BACI|nr:hypothetical protein [Cytobacillus eiseniae]MBP2242809.1 hypothetical protein [Cytobacillus eiseniae]